MLVSNDMTHDSRVDRHASALAEEGHEVIVLCPASSGDQPRLEVRRGYVIIRYQSPLREIRAKIVRKRRSELARPTWPGLQLLWRLLHATTLMAMNLPVRFWLYGLASKFRADICHCNDLDTLDVGVAMKILGTRKLVYDSHELWTERTGFATRNSVTFPFIRAVYLSLEKSLLAHADVVITVNPLMAREFKRMYKMRKRVWVVLNCPETSMPQSLPTPSKRSGTVAALYHGGFFPERGLENLVLACHHLRDGVRLIMRGDGELEGKLKQLASGLRNVDFEKSVPVGAVIEYAAQADIGVIAYLPTNLNHLYSSPNKLFEYMQAGLALVTSDLPFLRQIVVGSGIGLVFDPHDPRDIAQKVNLASQPDNLFRFKGNVQRFRDRYTWKYEKNSLYSAYRCLERGSGTETEETTHRCARTL